LVGVSALAFVASGCGESNPSRPPLTGAVAVSVGTSHACALMDDGSVMCWGSDALGELGRGVTGPAVPIPAPVAAISNARSVAAGASFTCSLAPDGTVMCWGANTFCELGNGCPISGLPGSESGQVDDPVPVAVNGLSGPATAVVTGSDLDGGLPYACALLGGGTVECWGANDIGIVDDNTVLFIAPTAVSGLSGATALTTGTGFACALVSGGSVACWGDGPLGQAGARATSGSTTPLAVTGLSDAVAVAAGDFHACALVADGTVHCWGMNSSGELGDGSRTDSGTPVAAQGVSGAVAIAAAGSSTCALLGDGTAKCWGTNTTVLTPAAVPGLAGAASISLGGDSACAVVSGGRIACWGDNSSGQLGNGVIDRSGAATTTPANVVSGSS
jgi:alpha-tubulin suppressor-like RCC1 family protein